MASTFPELPVEDRVKRAVDSKRAHFENANENASI